MDGLAGVLLSINRLRVTGDFNSSLSRSLRFVRHVPGRMYVAAGAAQAAGSQHGLRVGHREATGHEGLAQTRLRHRRPLRRPADGRL